MKDLLIFDEARKTLAHYTKLVADMEFHTGDDGYLDLQFLRIRLEGIKTLTKLVEDYANTIEELLSKGN